MTRIHLTKSTGTYLDRNDVQRNGKFWSALIEEDGWEPMTRRYPGSYTRKHVAEILRGNFGFDASIV